MSFGRFLGCNPLMTCSAFETQHCYHDPGDLCHQWFMFCLVITNQFKGSQAFTFFDVFITCWKIGKYIYTPKHISMFNSKGVIKLAMGTCQFTFLWFANGSNQNLLKSTLDSNKICHIFHHSNPTYFSLFQHFRHL